MVVAGGLWQEAMTENCCVLLLLVGFASASKDVYFNSFGESTCSYRVGCPSYGSPLP